MSWAQTIIDVIWHQLYNFRTATPGRVDKLATSRAREQAVDFEPGIPDLMAGQADRKAPTAGAPVLTIGGGGFYMCLPATVDDEALGIMSDRSLGMWRQTKNPGQVDRMNGLRTGSLSDVMVAPLMITAPPGAPESWSTLILGGPAGAAIDIAETGAITITKQGAPLASITLAASGSITIEVATGQDVKVGGAAAVPLPKWSALEAAIDALLAAGVAFVGSPADPTGENAGLAFAAAQAAWSSAKANVPTTKAKGE